MNVGNFQNGVGANTSIGLKVLVVRSSGEAVEVIGPLDETVGKLPEPSATCLVFMTPGGKLADPAALMQAFALNDRLAAAGLRRLDGEGRLFPSVCLAPTRTDLVCRLVLGWWSRRGLSSPGLPIVGFAHDRVLSVETVHPCAWAVRATEWDSLSGTSNELDWESGVQDFLDRLDRRALEVFFLPQVRVVGVDPIADPWCYPSRNLPALAGMLVYVRRRWGPWRARLFRWTFKPLFLARLIVELGFRVLFFWRKTDPAPPRSLGSRRDIGRFLLRDTIRFLLAG